jgi:hypothetical protein
LKPLVQSHIYIYIFGFCSKLCNLFSYIQLDVSCVHCVYEKEEEWMYPTPPPQYPETRIPSFQQFTYVRCSYWAWLLFSWPMCSLLLYKLCWPVCPIPQC